MTSEKKKINDIIVYTDGAYKKSTNACGYGIHFPNGEIKDIGRAFRRKPLTNQRAELYAIYKALRTIKRKYIFDTIHLYSDSEYSIKSVTIWINGWKKNNWKTAGGKAVSNQDLIMRIDKILTKFPKKIIFAHVKAHTGKTDKHSVGNQKADDLANIGAEKSLKLAKN